MTTLRLKKSIVRSPLRIGFLLIPLALVRFAVSPMVQAQLPSPSPDGGYPGENTAEGDGALSSVQISTTNITGNDNTAIGFDALFRNTTGYVNTATGSDALAHNQSGHDNTATGAGALESNTTGQNNTANGASALAQNNANDNTAFGYGALGLNTTGFENTAVGSLALLENTANDNTACGFEALFSNTTGNKNAAIGWCALFNNVTGGKNTANGFQALVSNRTGAGNAADGFQALANNTGSFNIAVGFTGGVNLTTGHDNIDIANAGVAGESGTLRIGNGKQTAAYIRGIYGQTVASGVGVIIDSSGHLGTVQSSARFKDAIRPMDQASEAILALKPVTFRYKTELDPDGVRQFGLIAEQVEKVNPELVVRDEDGKVTTVRYEAVNAMLLNEFLKEHGQVQQLKATIAQQQDEFHAKLAHQQKQIEALTATVQKVSDQVALSKPAPQLVANP